MTWQGFERMTPRSRQYISYHWVACSNHSDISDWKSKCRPALIVFTRYLRGIFIHAFELEFCVWFGLCCLMTSGLSMDIRCHVWPYFDKVQIIRSDIRPHIKWAVSQFCVWIRQLVSQSTFSVMYDHTVPFCKSPVQTLREESSQPSQWDVL